jgi:YfiH family protein
VVGAAHAGWRGLAGGVLQQTVARMREAGAGEVLAWLGPAIGPQCFEVGEDVRTAFAGRSGDFAEAVAGSGAEGAAGAFLPIAGKPGKYHADIYRLARAALAEAGGVEVHGGGFCTVTDRARFYSYRRDRETGRMASLIWLDHQA